MKKNNRNYYNGIIFTTVGTIGVNEKKNIHSKNPTNFTNVEDCEQLARDMIEDYKAQDFKARITNIRIEHTNNGKSEYFKTVKI